MQSCIITNSDDSKVTIENISLINEAYRPSAEKYILSITKFLEPDDDHIKVISDLRNSLTTKLQSIEIYSDSTKIYTYKSYVNLLNIVVINDSIDTTKFKLLIEITN